LIAVLFDLNNKILKPDFDCMIKVIKMKLSKIGGQEGHPSSIPSCRTLIRHLLPL